MARLGRDRHYCSLSCATKQNRLDEFSPFKQIFQNCKKNAKKKELEFGLDLLFLKKLWEDQNGQCAYTKKQMTFGKHLPTDMSLDRIDSEKGYIKGNVEWVCLFVNYGKNGFTKEQIVEFLT